MTDTLTNGERNLIMSGLGLLLLEARKPGGAEWVADPDEVRALQQKIQHGKADPPTRTRKPRRSVDQETLGRYAGAHGPVTLQEVAEAHNISVTQARRKLDGLVHQGRLTFDDGGGYQ